MLRLLRAVGSGKTIRCKAHDMRTGCLRASCLQVIPHVLRYRCAVFIGHNFYVCAWRYCI